MKELLEAISKIQELNHLNDRQLAQRLGVDPGTISRIKNRKAEPRLKFLNALARVYPETKLIIYEYVTKGNGHDD